jgi:tRNA(Arg) A34 adenosine deaminase TadA
VTFADQARRYVGERLPAAAPHSTEEMFLRLLDHGAQAREAGNYGIAAAFVLRSGGREIVCFGRNTVFSEGDPAGHAEMNALALARRLATTGEGATDGTTLVRPAPHDRLETLLYTTLEPCPMCTVALLNAGVQRVLLAQPDAAGGALLHLDRLPDIWSRFAEVRGLEVATAGDLPAELLDLLTRLFLDDKDALDGRLDTEPVLPVERLAAYAREQAGP